MHTHWAKLIGADFPPHSVTPPHYTNTTDHVLIVSGELELTLHDGTKRTCKAGDYIAQLGGIHAWCNMTDAWCSEYLLGRAPQSY